MNDPLRSLLIDDNPDDRALVMRELRREFPDLQVEQIIEAQGFASALEAGDFDLVITDYHLRWTDGLAVLRAVKECYPDCPVIMFTGTGTEEVAVEAMKTGLDDYVLKSPKHFARLPAAVRSARKAALHRQALKEAETRYQSLFDGVLVGLYRTTPEGQLLDANPAMVQMLGYPDRESLLAVNAADLHVDPEDRARWQALIEREGIVRDFEVRGRRHDGKIIWVRDTGRAVRDGEGRALYYEGSLEDITDRRRVEEALRESEARYADLYHNAPDLYDSLGPDGTILDINETGARMLGYTRQELLGRHVSQIVSSEFRERLPDEIAHHQERHEPVELEVPYRRKDDSTLWCHLRTEWVRDEAGHVLYSRDLARDITERRRTEATWRALNAAAAALQRAGLSEAEIYQAVGEQLTALGLRGAVSLLDEATDTFVFEHVFVPTRLLRALEQLTGLTSVGFRFPRARVPAFARAVESGEAVYVADGPAQLVKELPESVRGLAGRLAEMLGRASAILTPLRLEGRVAGLLHVAADWLTEADVPAINAFADQLSAALENARLYQTERQRAEQIAVVHALGRQITPLLDVDELLQTAAEALHERFGYLSVQLYLLDREAGEIEARGVAGEEGIVVRGYRQKVGQGITGEVAEQGKQVLIGDVGREPTFIPCVPGVQSELALPIWVRAEVAGVLNVESEQLHGFDEADVIALEALAGQIGAALENARLYEAERRQAEQLAALHETALDITTRRDMADLLEAIVARAARLLNVHGGGFYLLEPDGQTLRLTAVHGSRQQWIGTRLRRGEGVAGRVLDTGQPLIVEDYDRWEGRAAVYDQGPWGSVLSVPMLDGERVVGVLGCYDLPGAPRSFGPEDVALLEQFARQAVIAITNARLFEDAQRRLLEMTALQETALDIVSRLEMKPLLEAIMQRASDLLGATGGIMYRWDAEAQHLICVVSHRLSEDYTGTILWPGEGMAGRVYQTGEPLVVNDYAHWEGRAAHLIDIPSRAVISAPMLWQGQVIGVINIDDESGAQTFDDNDVWLLSVFANHAAIAIQNARLFEATRRQLEELTVLHAVATAGAEATSEDALIERVTKLIGQTLYADNFGVIRLDEAAGVLRDHHSYRGGEIVAPITVSLGQGITGQVAADGQPRRVPDVTREPGYFEADPGTRSELCVPLKAGERVIGVINVESNRLDAFTEADERLLTTLAGQLATAIQKVRLYTETRERAEQLATLNEIAQVVSAQLSADQVLETIYQQTQRIISLDAFFIGLVDKAANRLNYALLYDIGVSYPQKWGTLDEGSAVHHVAETGEPVLINRDPEQLEALSQPERRIGDVDRISASLMFVPLVVGTEVVGIISAQSYQPYAYGPQHLELLQGIASHAAIAIENARLFEAAQHELAERVRAEEALKEYSERLEEMVEERTRELQEAQEELVRKEKLATLGQLAGGMAHELRNPLGAISNAAYFLNMVGQTSFGTEEPDPEVKEVLEIMDKEVGTCEKIISSLLDFARTKPPIRRKVDVNAVVREALARTTVPENVEVVCQLDETLPSTSADPDQLGQVFGNIILNAVQAMTLPSRLGIPEGGRLTVKTSEVSGKPPRYRWVAVSITDTGVGIPEENLGKLFEPLFTTKAKGIGLGLALVKTLVEGHGGIIEVESPSTLLRTGEMGVGSTFTVRLPADGHDEI